MKYIFQVAWPLQSVVRNSVTLLKYVIVIDAYHLTNWKVELRHYQLLQTVDQLQHVLISKFPRMVSHRQVYYP